jgi:hypothetical protein
VKVLAVCTISPDAVSCWGMDGKPNIEQSKRTEAALLNQQNADVSFTYLKKNRYVVVRESQGIAIRRRGGNSPSQLLSRFEDTNDNGMSMIGVYHFALDNDVKTIDVPFSYSKKLGEASIELSKGASGVIGAQTIAFQDAHSVDTPANSGYQGRTWEIDFKVPGRTSEVQFREQLQSKDKTPIHHVDAKGNPVDDATFDNAVREGKAGSLYLRVGSKPGSTVDSLIVTTNVNPDRIGFIQFTENQGVEGVLTGIPADPNP